MKNLLRYLKRDPKPEPVLKIVGKVMSVVTPEPKKGAFKPTSKKVMAESTGRPCDEAITRIIPFFDEDKKHLVDLRKKGLFWAQCHRVK